MPTVTVPPPPPNPANSPLGRYLLHPVATSSDVEHHVLHVLEAIGRVVLPIALVLAAVVIAAVVLRLVLLLRRPDRLSVLVRIAPGPDVEPRGAETFWSACHGPLHRGRATALLRPRPHVAFEIEHRDGRLSFAVAVGDDQTAERVARALESAWPGTVTEVVHDARRERSGVLGGELRLVQPEWFSLRTDHPTDPYRHLLATLNAVGEMHIGIVQVLARPASAHRLSRARRAAVALRSGQPMSRLVRTIDAFRRTTPRPVTPLSADPFRANDVHAITEKASSTCFEVALRYGVATDETSRGARKQCRAKARDVAAAFALYGGRNYLTHHHAPHLSRRLHRRCIAHADLMTLDELAALAHLPSDLIVPGLDRAGAHAVSAPLGVESSLSQRREQSRAVKILGHDERRPERQVGIRVADSRQHLHVLGATGTGKSTLITNLVLQDAEAGRGAVVLDPKGDLVNDIMDRLPESAIGRVVLLDPDDDASRTAPPAMNVLDGADPYLAVDHLVSIFHRLFSAYWGPRTDDVLRSVTLSALVLPDATLADVPRLLTSPAMRRACLRHVEDPSVLGFWEDYDRRSAASQSEVAGPVMNKLRAVFTRPFVAAVLGASRSSFDLGTDVLDGGLLLARLPKGSLGDECSGLLGSLIVARVWQEVTARARRGESARVDATLYVDECQNFLNLPGSLSDMLAEARGYRLSVVAAHQFLDQLPNNLREALSSNARNKVVFNCSPEDARDLARHFQPNLSDYDLSHLDAYQVAARVVVDARELPAFTLRTEPAARPVPGRRQLIAEASRQRFGRPMTERRDETVRRNLAGRRGNERNRGGNLEELRTDDGTGSPLGTSLGRSVSSPLGIPHLPSRLDAYFDDTGSISSADEDTDSLGDL